MTDREVVRKDMEELYLGNLGTVEFDLELPEAGKHGSQISWHSDNLNFMDHAGRVSRPAYGRGNREVTMTACFRYGEYEEEKPYLVTILEENNRIEAAEIYPIRKYTVKGEEVCLPFASAVKTKDNRVIAHFVEWEGGPVRCWEQPGNYEVYGRLKDTQIPVSGIVEVGEDKLVPSSAVKEVKSCADYTKLFPGSDFYDAQERMHSYLLHTNEDQWLYNFRRAAGLPVRGASSMTGWDSPEGLLRGHSTGHYLSALALCYHATGDEEILKKAVYMTDALGECQDAFGQKEGYHKGFLSAYSEEQFDLLEKYTSYPKIWAPYYTLHKILAGLIDLYKLAGIPKAGKIAEGIGDWVYGRLSVLSHEQRVKMWSIYIAGEYGGMNESMAELYRLTGKKEFLEAARCFDNDRLFYPLEQGVDALDGMHANQHIPQIIGALKIYEMTGEKRYYLLSSLFWKIVTQFHMYAIGGTGESEMFHEAGNISGLLTKSTAESCATYNMLKLTGELYQYHPEAAYMDYYERAVYNHILSSCDHQPTGGSTYFLSMRPKAVKGFDLSENSCCHGTGLESHFKYAEHIFAVDKETVFVNLFIPSVLSLPDSGLEVTLKTEEENPGRIFLQIKAAGHRVFKIRRPYWAEGLPEILVNGDAYEPKMQEGYLVFHRLWEKDDEVEIRWPCTLRYEVAPDRANYFTVFFGPYILAALTEQEERMMLHAGNADEDFEREASRPLAFRCRENGCLFIPLEKVWKEEYQVYMKKG